MATLDLGLKPETGLAAGLSGLAGGLQQGIQLSQNIQQIRSNKIAALAKKTEQQIRVNEIKAKGLQRQADRNMAMFEKTTNAVVAKRLAKNVDALNAGVYKLRTGKDGGDPNIIKMSALDYGNPAALKKARQATVEFRKSNNEFLKAGDTKGSNLAAQSYVDELTDILITEGDGNVQNIIDAVSKGREVSQQFAGLPEKKFERETRFGEERLGFEERRVAIAEKRLGMEQEKLPLILTAMENKYKILPKDMIDINVKLRKSDEIKSYNIVNTQFNAIEKAILQKGDSLVASDQAIVTLFNKILDPTSVVRESEFARTEEGTAILNRTQARIRRIFTGGSAIGPDERRVILDMGREIRDIYGSIALKVYDTFSFNVGDDRGLYNPFTAREEKMFRGISQEISEKSGLTRGAELEALGYDDDKINEILRSEGY